MISGPQRVFGPQNPYSKRILTPRMDSPTTPGLYMFMLCYKNGVFPPVIVCHPQPRSYFD